jgi:phospholipase/carboxylesterase
VAFRERRAAAEAQGLLILHHGRGTSELDLLPLADALDPEQRLHVVTPRAPLQLPGAPGYHWYMVARVGYPDPDTFRASYRALAELHDELWQRTEIEPARTILGGFSMGTVMSYALGLGGERPPPAGILAFSGFVPTVEGWVPQLSDRQGTQVLIAHGQHDPVIEVGFARRARALLEKGGLPVDYRESEATHTIDPADLRRATRWIKEALPTSS